MNKGTLFVLTGPSGVGKGTVRKLMARERLNLFTSISATTRAPREGEQEGVHYYVLTKEQFEQKIREEAFLEYAQFADNSYGTLRAPVEEHLNKGENVLLEIEVQGAQKVMKARSDVISIFILPPSREELERRLVGRGTEDAETIRKRLEASVYELSLADHYQYRVVNDEVSRAVKEIEAILKQA